MFKLSQDMYPNRSPVAACQRALAISHVRIACSKLITSLHNLSPFLSFLIHIKAQIRIHFRPTPKSTQIVNEHVCYV